MRTAASLLAYSISCSLMHRLLRLHYSDACARLTWSDMLGLSTADPYCALVEKGLRALQWSPMAALVVGGRGLMHRAAPA